MKQYFVIALVAVLAYLAQGVGGRPAAAAAAAASVDPQLVSYLSRQLPGTKVTAVIPTTGSPRRSSSRAFNPSAS